MSPLFRDLPQLAQRMARWRAAAARFGRPETDALRLVLSERSIIDKVGPGRLPPLALWRFLASTQPWHKQRGRAEQKDPTVPTALVSSHTPPSGHGPDMPQSNVCCVLVICHRCIRSCPPTLVGEFLLLQLLSKRVVRNCRHEKTLVG
jgi:hypothetical protein